jgi:hypothetical protein
MRRLGSVQRKMSCAFVTEVKDEPSAKRERQVRGPAALQAPARCGFYVRCRVKFPVSWLLGSYTLVGVGENFPPGADSGMPSQGN